MGSGEGLLRGGCSVPADPAGARDEKMRAAYSPGPPVSASRPEKGAYDLFPAFHADGAIHDRLDALADAVIERGAAVFDGFEGVFWGRLLGALARIIAGKGRSVRLTDVRAAMKGAGEIDFLTAPYLGERGSIFGRMTDLRLIDFFDRGKLGALGAGGGGEILYGPGAALAGREGLLVYVDLPKNELQFRMAEGRAFNLGCRTKLDPRESYKRCYFVDWPVLDGHRGRLLGRMDWVVDDQRAAGHACMEGGALRRALDGMCRNSFRARPWFAPGVWGGTFLRDNVKGLGAGCANVAWSYELMALENGILLEHGGVLLEVPFSCLMARGGRLVLGACAEDFQEDFPIRFDFLDTVRGGNLSIQCHPRPEYIRSRFGKKYTQDETYYILQADAGARVYLGFREGVREEAFRAALENSQATGEAVDIDRFVQSFPSRRHDLFLIPNGTVHASGAGNLVLEISSAPYIFTFKMYDWVRLDIDGRPRPINIEHGLNNVRFERSGAAVGETLLCRPRVIGEDGRCRVEHLPTHRDHFYDVHRYTIRGGCSAEIVSGGKCHVWMVVEGLCVEVAVKGGGTAVYSYLETFIVPAAAGAYRLSNRSGRDVTLVKAFVKDRYEL